MKPIGSTRIPSIQTNVFICTNKVGWSNNFESQTKFRFFFLRNSAIIEAYIYIAVCSCIILANMLYVTMAIQALISYERRKVITSVSVAIFSSRVFILLFLSIVTLTTFWVTMYTVFVKLQYIPLRIVERNSSMTINVCIAQSRVFPGFLELVFATTEQVIPGSIIIYNYW